LSEKNRNLPGKLEFVLPGSTTRQISNQIVAAAVINSKHDYYNVRSFIRCIAH